jgi:Ser/Thr protein kinase RdoA (MazF antagonist)
MEKLKVHGLTENWVDPDWPFLTLPELNALLRRFSTLGRAEAILSYSPRPFSAASTVSTGSASVFVKRHHRSVRDREGLLEEHRFIQHLAAQGSPVPTVLEDDYGETAICEGEWTYEVHSIPPGLDLYKQDLSWTPFRATHHAHAAGKALAMLHNAASGYDAPARDTKTLVTSLSILGAKDPWLGLEQYIAARPVLADFLEKNKWREKAQELIGPYFESLRPWLADLRPLWTHNDLHASNLFWTGSAEIAEVSAIIDFGLSDPTNAVHDLATAIERNGVRWLSLEGEFEEVVHLDQTNALLAGYEQIRPLSDVERQALVSMLPVVHVEFALSETDYFLRILKSEEKASISWDRYCIGHAAWFNAPPGQKLLAHLKSWAESENHDTKVEQVSDVRY